MKREYLVGAVILAAGVFAFSYFGSGAKAKFGLPATLNTVASKPGHTMPAFASEAELKAKLKKSREANRGQAIATDGASNQAASSPSLASGSKDDSKAASSAKEPESITNNQTAGVDEGGIVKVHGEQLVILRRGRLFTVKVGDSDLRAISSINAYPPEIDPSSDWYDEMLVSGDTVIVIGYSYGRGGTEINRFNIDTRGHLSYRSTYHLRSNDYYSSRNYASRLIGSKLVFYTPQYLGYSDDPMQQFPAVRKWHKGASDGEFKPVVSATHVYYPAVDDKRIATSALHTVTVCDLASAEMTCKGTAVVGAPGRVFYVAESNVYVWSTDWRYEEGKPETSSMLYRIPLDGSAPSSIGVAGAPIDQFSFLENDGQLNVIVNSDGRGEQMWGSEYTLGPLSLLRLKGSDFGDGSNIASIDDYRSLPRPEGYTLQNRFVGDYVLYGSGNGWGRQSSKTASNLFAVNWRTANVSYLNLPHSVDRIEQLGRDAVVVGVNGSDLYFSPVKLGSQPEVRDPFIRRKASQGELRSHGFFYKPDSNDSGLLGLPIAREGRSGYRHLVEGSAAILFLRNDGLEFNEAGEIASRDGSPDDGCRASCVDWYGNARPIFLRGRVFALLGYELIEGRVDDGRIREVRRVNYSPRKAVGDTPEA